MAEKDQYISFEEVEAELGVTRATLLYYVKKFNIARKTFVLDRKAYMKRSDFERIQRAKRGFVEDDEINPAA